MINTFVYPLKTKFYKLLCLFLDKEYKENINTLSINIQTKEFQKLINLFNPEKITYESILFYSKYSEPLKEMVSSDFNIFIFESKEELEQEIQKIKERDLQIIHNYLNSKSITKNPNIKPQIEIIKNYVENYPNLNQQKLVEINYLYKEVITLLSLISVKKNLIILDSDKETKENLTLYIPLSILVELTELPPEEIPELLKIYNIQTDLNEAIKKAANSIIDNILSHWTIFYTGNKKEVKQYLIPINTDVLTASAKIHTDIAKKFIQAEVCNITEMNESKLPPFSTFGKTYIVKNHDYLSIKTS